MKESEIIIKKGVKKGHPWCAVYLHLVYDSKKTYTKFLDFITQREYDLLKETGIKSYEKN